MTHYTRSYQPSFSPESIVGKSLPVNIDAERAVLSAILLNDDYIVRVSEKLLASDFYHHQHTLIYQAMLDIVAVHRRIDMVTLHDELVKKGQLEAVGGLEYLVNI
ncbi:MAG TPA: DnaB-like helicase N-terminal domain-containing protein, partial [Candidatus Bathyarchaeia archaeon]|nr:DnaB-like helicase N-terminal domain-containing protein [Candidatus Bathyarchaeia archaeon]